MRASLLDIKMIIIFLHLVKTRFEKRGDKLVYSIAKDKTDKVNRHYYFILILQTFMLL